MEITLLGRLPRWVYGALAGVLIGSLSLWNAAFPFLFGHLIVLGIPYYHFFRQHLIYVIPNAGLIVQFLVMGFLFSANGALLLSRKRWLQILGVIGVLVFVAGEIFFFLAISQTV